jgi:hypothetical protein
MLAEEEEEEETKEEEIEEGGMSQSAAGWGGRSTGGEEVDSDQGGGMRGPARHLSTSSLGRNRRLSFLDGLLARSMSLSAPVASGHHQRKNQEELGGQQQRNIGALYLPLPSKHLQQRGGGGGGEGIAATTTGASNVFPKPQRQPPKLFVVRALRKLADDVLPDFCRGVLVVDQGAPPRSRTAAARSIVDARMAAEMGEWWETCTAPLFLLAGAEALYHGLDHCSAAAAPRPSTPTEFRDEDGIVVVALDRLYQRIADDLRRVKVMMCEPILAEAASTTATPTMTTSTASQPKDPSLATATTGPMATFAPTDPSSSSTVAQRSSLDVARDVAASLDAMAAYCAIRIRLIAVQRALFSEAWLAATRPPDSTGGMRTTMARAHHEDVTVTADADANDRSVETRGTDPWRDCEDISSAGRRAARDPGPTRSWAPARVLAEAADAVRHLLHSLAAPEIRDETRPAGDEPIGDGSSSPLPPKAPHDLFRDLRGECSTWKHCLESALALERCQ